MYQTITFGAGPSAQNVTSVQINITNDEIALEAIERYDINLEIVGSITNVVTGRHEMTTVNVLDEDRKFSLPVHCSLVMILTFMFVFSCDCWFWKQRSDSG